MAPSPPPLPGSPPAAGGASGGAPPSSCSPERTAVAPPPAAAAAPDALPALAPSDPSAAASLLLATMAAAAAPAPAPATAPAPAPAAAAAAAAASAAVLARADAAVARGELRPPRGLERDPDFMMYCYKVLPCPRRTTHDWGECPWAHPRERAARRCPRRFAYASSPCAVARAGGACARGAACEGSHSINEYWLHPARYRTEWCSLGSGCDREVCFFAHSAPELRVPAATPGGSVPAGCADERWELGPAQGGKGGGRGGVGAEALSLNGFGTARTLQPQRMGMRRASCMHTL